MFLGILSCVTFLTPGIQSWGIPHLGDSAFQPLHPLLGTHETRPWCPLLSSHRDMVGFTSCHLDEPQRAIPLLEVAFYHRNQGGHADRICFASWKNTIVSDVRTSCPASRCQPLRSPWSGLGRLESAPILWLPLVHPPAPSILSATKLIKRLEANSQDTAP
jgi:hypothetical protein